MIFLTILKSVFAQILPFILRYYKEILIAVMTLLYLNAKSDYSAIVSEYEAFKDKQAQIVAEKAKEAELLRKAAEIQHKNAYQRYQQEIVARDLNREKLKKDLTHEKTRIASLLNDVRVYQNCASSGGLSETESAAQLPAESGADSDRTVAQLIKACQQTTIDYNALRDAWDIECDLKGCEK